MRMFAVFAVIIALLAGPSAFAASGEPTNDDQKTLYALGLAISQSLGTYSQSLGLSYSIRKASTSSLSIAFVYTRTIAIL